jgi:flavin reductase (DIM6/NTAB) family NADH-FMN oxidoreductase RutF
MPSGLYVLGSAAAGRRNLMTLNWASQVSTKPKLVAVSVESGAVTHRLVQEGGSFSLNILNREDRSIVRKFVKPLDDTGDPDHLAGFEVKAASTGCPILAQAAAWLDCEVRHDVRFDSHTLFVGEVVNCGGEPAEEAEMLRMEDTRMSYGG